MRCSSLIAMAAVLVACHARSRANIQASSERLEPTPSSDAAAMLSNVPARHDGEADAGKGTCRTAPAKDMPRVVLYASVRDFYAKNIDGDDPKPPTERDANAKFCADLGEKGKCTGDGPWLLRMQQDSLNSSVFLVRRARAPLGGILAALVCNASMPRRACEQNDACELVDGELVRVTKASLSLEDAMIDNITMKPCADASDACFKDCVVDGMTIQTMFFERATLRGIGAFAQAVDWDFDDSDQPGIFVQNGQPILKSEKRQAAPSETLTIVNGDVLVEGSACKKRFSVHQAATDADAGPR